ncbi:MAG: family peptidase [Ferruginibacter sp.]|nr:family peptidase [Ferruginibacter sp.]
MRKIFLLLLLLPAFDLLAQDAIEYKTPPAAIRDLVLAKPTPSVSFDHDGQWVLIMERSSMPTVEDLAQPELRIAGLRINPNNFSASRASYLTGFSLKNISSGMEFKLTGLPSPLRAGNVQWSPDEKKFAFTQASTYGVDLYSVDIAARKATKVNKQPLNILLGDAFSWLDGKTLLYKTVIKPYSAAPAKPLAPKGPVVQQNLGKVAASVTYQDLIKSPMDEANFEFYATTQLIKNNGIETKLGAPAIYNSIDVSPDQKYLLIEKINKPFSYLVPAGGFNSTVYITDINGKLVKSIVNLPSSELAPRGNDNVLNAPRGHQWLDNQPATISWIEPLDSGLIKNNMPYHDAAYTLPAPFTGAPKQLVKTAMRMGSVRDINNDLFLVTEYSSAKHRSKTSRLNPNNGELDVLIDRSTDDAYNDPGTPVTDKNKYGRNSVRLIDGSKMLMRGTGATAKGDMPFLSSFDLTTKKSTILWRSADPDYELVTTVLDFDKLRFITSKQSQTQAPNYFLRSLQNNSVKQLTNFPDPQPQLRGISKQKISYKRKDGIDLAADLYLPAGYDPKRDGRLPVLMWAYPREFKSATDAAQVRGSNNTFTRIGYGSAIFWVTQGYAIMDNTEFPIVGEGEKQPNDNFIDQLTWNAEAAINKIDEMGIGDRNRIAVGGHSYGAFMTANLLAHTSLFKAGIARSGAYNRTLTPFGFQNEERTYWQAPDVYFNMSPFSYADKIKTPLLMIHGEADNNPGTFPIQSERLFNAIKGHGGTVRFVQLPFESHGYAAKENILHMLWEMNEWLNTYVKKAK